MLLIYILVGILVEKTGLIKDQEQNSLSILLTNVALPCAIFNSFQMEYSNTVLVLIFKSLVVGVAFFLGLYLISKLCARIFKIPSDKRNVWIGCSTFSSILFIGIPIVGALFGQLGLVVLVAFNTVGNFAVFGCAESVFSGNRLFSFAKLFSSPAIITAGIGFLLFVLGLEFPTVIASPIETLGSLTTPISMIVNGIMLSKRLSLKLFTNLDTIQFCVLRLIIMPIILIIIAKLFIRDEILLQVTGLAACMPSGAINSVFAEKYAKQGSLASEYVILSTLMCIITIPIVFYIFFN